MAALWVILGRVLRAGPGLDVADAGAEHAAVAQDEHAAAMEAEEGAQAEEHVVAMDVDAEPQAQEAEHAAEPDFTLPVELPPRVTVLAAGRGAHPDADKPDKYPYIIAAGRLCLLAHFAVAPYHGTCFDHDPESSHLVLVRFGYTADGRTTAVAEHVPRRTGLVPALWNVSSVGLLSSDNNGRHTIAELQVRLGSDRATLVCFESKLAALHPSGWSSTDVTCPFPGEDRGREWVPHGAVSIGGSSICWFDLSWGMLVCDHVQTRPSFNFHHLPGGRALAEATPDIHTRRCITVTMETKRCVAVNRLRYVEINAPEGEAATVTMWTRIIGDRGRWEWEVNYEVSFESIWNDDSYKKTSLPRIVPVLAVVSPSDHELVYFALEQHLVGVDVPRRRVVHCAAYDLVNIPGTTQPGSGRFLVPWNLSPSVAHALGINRIVGGFDAAAQNAPLQAALIDNKEDPAGEMEDEEQPEIDYDDQPAVEPHAAVVYDGVQTEEINRIIDSGMFAPDKLSSDEETLEPGMDLTMQMDQGTLDRLKAEIQEEFAKDQDSGDDAGQGSL